jgi:cytochrome P450
LFAGISALRGCGVVRVGSRVVVNDADALREVLTRVPLDRVSDRTTGGVIRRHDVHDAIFDEAGAQHRASRRDLARRLDASGVAALREVWTPVLAEADATLRSGGELDMCVVADEIAGRTTAALLGLDLSPACSLELARAARATAAAAAAGGIPSLRRRRFRDPLAELLGDSVDGQGTMLAMAAVTTTHATLPRAVAWVADDGLWPEATDDARRAVLVRELLRVLAPTPLLPRVPAQRCRVGGRRVSPSDQLVLMVRHAVDAHSRGPSVRCPAPEAMSQLVFGVGSHACPGAGLARAQLADTLAMLAPSKPRVVSARADRGGALPAWSSLRIVR